MLGAFERLDLVAGQVEAASLEELLQRSLGVLGGERTLVEAGLEEAG